MDELIKKLHDLANRWEYMAIQQVPKEYADRNLYGKYLRLDNEAAGLSNCAEELRALLNIENCPTKREADTLPECWISRECYFGQDGKCLRGCQVNERIPMEWAMKKTITRKDARKWAEDN